MKLLSITHATHIIHQNKHNKQCLQIDMEETMIGYRITILNDCIAVRTRSGFLQGKLSHTSYTLSISSPPMIYHHSNYAYYKN